MATANPLWGAPRIHGELMTLGLAVAERTIARLLPRRRRPPSQTWRTFLRNHVASLVAIDFFTVPTLTGRVLFVLVVLAIVLNEQHVRRLLRAYLAYDHRSRTPLALGKDTPDARPVAAVGAGQVVALPEVGGLHHRYERRAAA